MTCTPVQIINLEIKDNHEDATLGAFLLLQICDLVSSQYQIWLLMSEDILVPFKASWGVHHMPQNTFVDYTMGQYVMIIGQ